MKILYVTAEATPFAKVGGLADVAGALPSALRRQGVDARLILPCYQTVLDNKNFSYENEIKGLEISFAGSPCAFLVRQTQVLDVPVYLIDMPYYFHRDNVYGYADDADRFAAFCMAVIKFLKVSDWTPDVVHCNDWHTALAPALVRNANNDQELYDSMATVFSIHNLAYQGIVPADMLGRIGLPFSEFTHHKVEFFGQVNIMKSGIYYADRVNTVSPAYAREILTAEHGHGLDGMLKAHESKLSGILNGIDTVEFNPATDSHISHAFSLENPSAKKDNKRALMKETGLRARDADLAAPLIGMVTRITDQKGFDILTRALEAILKRNVRFVILGSGAADYEQLLISAAASHPQQMAVRIGFDEALARRVYAGSDMFLMPSQFEPCGLGQMIAMRYGSVPIVRATGGLADTVAPFDASTLRGNGFTFDEYTPAALIAALRNAVALYHNHPNAWQSLVRIIMAQDFSWDASAGKYQELYSQAKHVRQSSHQAE